MSCHPHRVTPQYHYNVKIVHARDVFENYYQMPLGSVQFEAFSSNTHYDVFRLSKMGNYLAEKLQVVFRCSIPASVPSVLGGSPQVAAQVTN